MPPRTITDPVDPRLSEVVIFSTPPLPRAGFRDTDKHGSVQEVVIRGIPGACDSQKQKYFSFVSEEIIQQS